MYVNKKYKFLFKYRSVKFGKLLNM